MRRPVLTAAARLSLGAACLLAQEQNQPTIRVTTRLVQVNVVVHDKKGEPVGDLKKEEFALLNKGKEQRIAVFAVDSADAPQKGWPGLPPNVFSNTKFEDQAYAKEQIIKFLGTLQPSDRVALYLLGSNLRILHDFTNDADHLVKALAKYRGRIAGELDAADPALRDPSGNDDPDQFLNNADQTISDFYNVMT